MVEVLLSPTFCSSLEQPSFLSRVISINKSIKVPNISNQFSHPSGDLLTTLDTLKEVLSQTLASGNGVNGEELELILKDNLNTLMVTSPERSPVAMVTSPVAMVTTMEQDHQVAPIVVAEPPPPKVLKVLNNTAPTAPVPHHQTPADVFNTTSYGLQKSVVNYGGLFQHSALFKPKEPLPFSTPSSTFSPSILQKQFETAAPVSTAAAPVAPVTTTLPKIFSPGVIRSEPEVKPGSPQQQAFSTITRPLFTADHQAATTVSYPTPPTSTILLGSLKTTSGSPTYVTSSVSPPGR
eukprot:sb/3467539/